MEQSSKSIFQAAYDFVRSCLSNNKTQVHEVVVEKADPHVGNQKPVGSKFVVSPYSLLLYNIRFSKAEMFEKEEKCCNLFFLCTGKTKPLLADMAANRTHQRTTQLLQVAFETSEHGPFDK